jgi:hypothetical protein
MKRFLVCNTVVCKKIVVLEETTFYILKIEVTGFGGRNDFVQEVGRVFDFIPKRLHFSYSSCYYVMILT